ncbi:BspA family leucine-rich repeat surface protein [Adlercreutzia equolifaciens]|uniref:BspA family leucine-rich repeat surface protein n=1 Tax=Adlercreutzia equolifaciens TaxID=446660 RepID=UPI0023B13B76|nr:BspA family leucine-rich repeat surface protein [Adlercreutzia equolifaciens]MDE8703502.1 BspA family leucine-rich repeat surface protein [Adlercreutzia equolifaciens]
METTTRRPHRPLHVLLAALLCLACVPAQTLAGAGEAWAASPTPLFYETIYKKGKDYTLVLQKDARADRSFGAKVWQKAIYSWAHEDYSLDDLRNEDGSIYDAIDELDYTRRNLDEDVPYEPTRIIVRDRIQAPANCERLFNFSSCIFMDLSGLDTSHAVTMRHMFSCDNLRSIKVSGFDTSNVEDMGGMFDGCRELRSVNLSGLDTGNVADMSYMFSGCEKLRSVKLSGLDTGNVTDMSYMFEYCENLREIDLSGLDTHKVKDMSSMFSGCDSLLNIDLSSFDTRSVKKATWMFFRGVNVRVMWSIDISHFSLPSSSYDSAFFPYRTYSVKLPKKQATVIGRRALSGVFKLTNPQKRVFCSTGKWLNSKNKAYSPKNIPNVADTYRQQLDFSKAPLTMASQEYTGTRLQPSLKFSNGGTLKKGLDYTVTFKNNKNVGTATAVVKGKGHIGKKTITFKINPKGTQAKSLKAAKKGFKLTWKKLSAAARSQIDGYQVRYATASSMKGAKTVTVKGAAKTSAKVTKLKGNKTYYVQVRSYKKVSGKTYYSTWSATKSVKTKK